MDHRKEAVTLTLPARGSTFYVYLASIVAATSGLLFGFDIAVINGALLFLRRQFGLTEFQTEIAASSLLVGCVAGASIAGWMSDRFGRRKVLMVSAILFALSSIGAALPRSMEEFIAARFLGGIAIGMASVLAPVYIAEVAPARIRGRLVSLNQMAIVTGILLAYFVNWVLSFQGEQSWRWMFASAALPSAAFLAALFFVPESPRWLVENQRASEALLVMARVGGSAEAYRQLDDIEAAIAEESGTFADLLQPGMRRALIVGIVLAVLQQITGINTVLFYGSVIFKNYAGTARDTSAIGASVIIGLVNFLATIVAIATIDKLGRKPLLFVSSACMAVCQLALAGAFAINPPPPLLVLALMLVCVASFAIGLGPGVWVLLAEIFPTRIRGRAMGVATVSLWIACAALTLTFLSLAKALGASGAFALYGFICVFTAWFVWRFTPETKGRTLEEIESLWRH
ncbi:MAG: sugar porter family MFS transporter [Bryobacterales bacterium]|nr:sugar porter family MFS transporter [Bryobacterales bacterium]